jgi:hypothetical protein
VVAEAVGNQHDTDDDQEGQGQHLDRRVIRDEFADGAGEQHHQADRGDDGGNHHADLADHADRGNDRIERETPGR